MTTTPFKYHLIRHHRDKLKYSQADLAFVLRQLGMDIHPSTVHSWEQGETTPDADKVPTLAKALQLEIIDFYE